MSGMTHRRPMLCLTRVVTILALVAIVSGCDTFVPAPDPNTPTGNFEALWREFDARYALFGVRHVDWDSLYAVNRPRVSDTLDGPGLFSVMRDLLAPLEDGHVFLDAPGVGWFIAGANPDSAYFPDGVPANRDFERFSQDDLIISRFLDHGRSSAREFAPLRPELTGTRKLEYLGIYGFGDMDPVSWDEIMGRMSTAPDCDGLIIDVRGNRGGLATRVADVVGPLLDHAIVYATMAVRNGPGRDDLAPSFELSVAPRNAGWADVPVVVLTDPFTASAAEWFTLAMRLRARTTIIGARTKGILSSRSDNVLPNGWAFSCSSFLVRDADGVCWEGIGLEPQLYVRNTLAANHARRDLALELAITLLGGAPLP